MARAKGPFGSVRRSRCQVPKADLALPGRSQTLGRGECPHGDALSQLGKEPRPSTIVKVEGTASLARPTVRPRTPRVVARCEGFLSPRALHKKSGAEPKPDAEGRMALVSGDVPKPRPFLRARRGQHPRSPKPKTGRAAATDLCEPAHTPAPLGFITMRSVTQTREPAPCRSQGHSRGHRNC